ncbi:CHR23 [Symbiodinium microadriaticum]|nr:CHR23 [Symbiodinium microadriaticum]
MFSGGAGHGNASCRPILGVPQGRKGLGRSLSACRRPDRVKGLYRATRAPRRELSLRDKVDRCVSQCEQMSSERTDPAKLRFKRLLKAALCTGSGSNWSTQ